MEGRRFVVLPLWLYLPTLLGGVKPDGLQLEVVWPRFRLFFTVTKSSSHGICCFLECSGVEVASLRICCSFFLVVFCTSVGSREVDFETSLFSFSSVRSEGVVLDSGTGSFVT